MKTTLNIPNELMKQLKRKAADTGKTLSDVVAETLQNGLKQPAQRKKLSKLPTFDCGKAYVNVSDRDQLYRAMEGK